MKKFLKEDKKIFILFFFLIFFFSIIELCTIDFSEDASVIVIIFIEPIILGINIFLSYIILIPSFINIILNKKNSNQRIISILNIIQKVILALVIICSIYIFITYKTTIADGIFISIFNNK